VLSYRPYIPDEYRREASYVDRILKSAKPSELPVQAPIKFELVINLKTAKALGLEVAGQLQQLADELIEQVHVCHWHKADMVIALSNVRFRGKADILVRSARFWPPRRGRSGSPTHAITLRRKWGWWFHIRPIYLGVRLFLLFLRLFLYLPSQLLCLF
jgi:hypothetical protein